MSSITIAVLISLLPGFHLHASYPALALPWLAVAFGVVSGA